MFIHSEADKRITVHELIKNIKRNKVYGKDKLLYEYFIETFDI